MSRILKAGTILVGAADRRAGSSEPVTIAGTRVPMKLVNDTAVEFEGDSKDETFVGILLTNAENFKLNIGSVPGTWSPVTGARMPSECACGSEIPAAAEDQTTCGTCLATVPAKAAGASIPFAGIQQRGVVAERRVTNLPLNEAPERRKGVKGRRAPVKAVAAKASAKPASRAAVSHVAPRSKAAPAKPAPASASATTPPIEK